MRNAVVVACLMVLFVAAPVFAGEVILHMPDDQIQTALQRTCQWFHCGYGTDQDLAVRAADAVVNAISHGQFPTVAALHGQVEIRYATEHPPVQP